MQELFDTGHEAEEQKIHTMTTEPVGRLLAKLSVPTVISMLVTSFYNLADTFFVRQLENDSMVAALGVSLTVMAIIQATGFFFGHGSGNYISRTYGMRDYRRAEIMAATGFYYSLMAGCVISVLGLSLRVPLAAALGAKTAATSGYTVDYMTYILAVAPLMTGSLVMNNQLRLQGNAFFAMLGITSGVVLNLVLDPLFIFAAGDTLFSGAVTMPFGLGMGVGGAAFATAVSQGVGFVILAVGIYRSDNIKIHIKNFTFSPEYFKNIVGGGLPSLMRQGLASVSIICVNHAVGLYILDGALVDATQAAVTGVNKIAMLLGSAVIGFGQGFQPICGFNYGAKRYDRVLKALNVSMIVGTVFLTVVAVVMFIFSPQVCSAIIGSSRQTTEIAALTLRAQMVTLPLMAVLIMFNMFLQNIGQTLRATLCAMARSGLMLIPCVFLLPPLLRSMGYGVLPGIQLAQAASDVLSIALVLPLGLPVVRRLKAQADK